MAELTRDGAREALAASAFDPARFEDEYTAPQRRAVRAHAGRLDDVMPGGLMPGVYSVVAPPGCGKTALLLHMALRQALVREEGGGLVADPTAVVTLEMGAGWCWARMCSELSATPGTGMGLERFEWSRIQDMARDRRRRISEPGWDDARDPFLAASAALRRRAPWLWVFGPERAGDLAGLLSLMGQFAAAGGRMMTVDYLQLVRTGVPRQSEYERVTQVVGALRDAAHSLGVVVVAAAATNREASRSNDGMHGAAGSGLVEFASEGVLALEPDPEGRVRGPDGSPDPSARVVLMHVAKNRYGAVTPKDRPVRLAFWPAINFIA